MCLFIQGRHESFLPLIASSVIQILAIWRGLLTLFLWPEAAIFMNCAAQHGFL